mgnify:CR=1 FL=1
MRNCIHCVHANMRQAAAKGMAGFFVCNKGNNWEYNNRDTECENNHFQTVSDDVIAGRIAWFEKRKGKK